ncbi:hypothetical protein EDD85DRAFT_606007 [Armillaria nabsnona]|nr:hypothetical protein EDD85DRAFT_606007 [Armillaria nabsnona]
MRQRDTALSSGAMVPSTGGTRSMLSPASSVEPTPDNVHSCLSTKPEPFLDGMLLCYTPTLNGDLVPATSLRTLPIMPAQVCITSDVVQLSYSGDPVCQSHTISPQGSLVGTEGEVDIEVDQSFDTDTSYTVSSASTIGFSNTLEVKGGIPEIDNVTDALTISAEVTDTTSSTFKVSYNDVSKFTIKMTAQEGQTCTAVTNTKTCNIQATGQIRYLATGRIWFNYNSATQGHYKWAVNIESVLTNQDDRSSFATLKGSMIANTQTSYAGSCQ